MVRRGEAADTLAVLGLDWDKTREADLLATFKSFCPAGDTVLKVVVHPSEYGIEQMEKEARLGPEVLSRTDSRVLKEEKKRKDPADGHRLDMEISKKGERRICTSKQSGKAQPSNAPGLRRESEASDSERSEDSTDDLESGNDLGDAEELDADSAGRKAQDALRAYEANRLK